MSFSSRLVQLHEWRAERIHLEEQSQEKVAELQQNISALQTDGGRLQEHLVSFTSIHLHSKQGHVLLLGLCYRSNTSFLPLTGSYGRAEDGGRRSDEATETRDPAVQGNNWAGGWALLTLSRSHVHSQGGGVCVLSSDVALPLLSQDELDKQQAEKKKVSDVLEELTQRREKLQAQVRANTSSASITDRHAAAADILSQMCVGVSEQVDELSTSLQKARGQQAAAGEELRRREETIGTLHSGDVIPPLSPLHL